MRARGSADGRTKGSFQCLISPRPTFWIAVLQIIAIDILLGGDNAVVIALACRRAAGPAQRNKGIFWGVFGAIGLRVVLIYFALQLLAVPYLKIVGGLLLFWIGIKLILPEHEDAHGNVQGSSTLIGAIKTIIVADAVMSVDNVIAVAGAAHGSIVLVVFGIAVSIPIVVWGSKLVLTLMDRFPIVITAGGGCWAGSAAACWSPTRHFPVPGETSFRTAAYLRLRRSAQCWW
jgi:YjbE family integral membrane protein